MTFLVLTQQQVPQVYEEVDYRRQACKPAVRPADAARLVPHPACTRHRNGGRFCIAAGDGESDSLLNDNGADKQFLQLMREDGSLGGWTM